MFSRMADLITQKLQENKMISSEQYEICRFGFQQGLTIILNLVTVIVIGAVLRELGQALLFMGLYVPLRSNAGGYHARTAVRCYLYSIIYMIAILLAMKYIIISYFICNMALIISCVIIVLLSPVEDANKPLDDTEQMVYKKRTYIVTTLEILILIIAFTLNARNIILCIMWVYITMGLVLLVGKCRNILFRVSDKVH